MDQARWPRWVYEDGSEPDVRFTLANERTFLAWVRTALALVAGGVAVDALDLPIYDRVKHALALALVLLGLLCATASWVRWARAERSMRRGEPLPGAVVAAVLAAGVAVVTIVLLAAML